MILQALTRYYEDLLRRGEIAAPGWSPAKISFALCLDKDGQVTQVIPTMEEVAMGKKTVLRPQEKELPVGTIPAIYLALTKKEIQNGVRNIFWRQKNYITQFWMV